MLVLILFKLKNIIEQQASNKDIVIKFRQDQCKQKYHLYKTKLTDQECPDKCYGKYVSKLYPQISKKLLASENTFYDESTKLSLIADTLDAMFFNHKRNTYFNICRYVSFLDILRLIK